MELALGKRGKLWLLVGIPIIFLLVVLFYLTITRDAIRVDFAKVHPGMTLQEVDALQDEMNREMHLDVRNKSAAFLQRDTLLLPASRIKVDFDSDWRVIGKSIYRPTMSEIWNHWMRQLGL